MTVTHEGVALVVSELLVAVVVAVGDRVRTLVRRVELIAPEMVNGG